MDVENDAADFLVRCPGTDSVDEMLYGSTIIAAERVQQLIQEFS